MEQNKEYVTINQSQVEAYKRLIKMGATEENILGLINEETLNEIKIKVAEEEKEIKEQDGGFNMKI